ncbi:MAG TPA: chloride channel protein [Planctomycetota bacterium]|nr:chloride channel protein [Planctomycetota bacterium]
MKGTTRRSTGPARFPGSYSRLGRTILLSIVVGFLAGLAAKGLESGVQLGVGTLIKRYSDSSGTQTLQFRWPILLFPGLGGLLSGLLVGLLCRPTRAHGTAVLIDAFHHYGAEISLRDSILKALAATAVIALGCSVGKEAPIAVLGAAIGTTAAAALGMTPRERRLFLIAGCAAGVGAIFQCPLGGALFATTVLYREPEIEGDALLPSIIASVTSYSTFMAFGGYGHRLLEGTRSLVFRSPLELAPYAGLAMLCAAVGILFFHSMKAAPRLLAKLHLPRWLTPAVAGLLGGLIACAIPQVMDSQYGFIQRALDGPGKVQIVIWLQAATLFAAVIIAKCVATSLMMGSDSAGGLFGPVVFMGGAVGAAMGSLLEALFPGAFPESLRRSLIPVGMAGVLSASLRTPLAAIVMVTEMTGSYGLIVPLMLVSMISYLLGRRWGVYAEQVGGPHDSPAHAGESVISLLESLRVRDLMEELWPFVVGPEKTLPELVSLMTRGTRPTFAVVDGRRLIGTIPPSNIAAATGGDVPSRVFCALDLVADDLKVVYLEDDLYSTLDLFRRLSLDVLPVMDQRSGDYAGMLSREAISKTLRKRLADQRFHMLREHSGLTALAQESLLENLLSEIASHATGQVRRMSVPVEIAGKSLKDSGFRSRYGSQVIAVQRATGELFTPPDPEHLLEKGDTLIVFHSELGNDHRPHPGRVPMQTPDSEFSPGSRVPESISTGESPDPTPRSG